MRQLWNAFVLLLTFLPFYTLGQGFSALDSIAVEALIDSSRSIVNVEPDRAMEIAKVAEYQAHMAGYTLGVLRTWNLQGDILSNKGGLVESEKIYQKCLILADSLGRPMAVGAFLDKLGSSHRLLGNYPESLRYHEQAMSIFDSLGNKEGISVCLNNMAIINKYMGEVDIAMGQYRKAGAIAAASGNDLRMSTFHANIGILYMDLGNLDSAEFHLRQVLEIARENGYVAREAEGLSQLGSVLNRRGKPKEALELFNEAQEIARYTNNNFLLASLLVKEGSAFLKLEKPVLAKAKLEAAIQSAKKLGSLEIQKTSLRLLHLAEAKLGNHEKALGIFKEAVSIEDSLLGVSMKEKVAQIREQYSAERKERKLTEMSLELEREVRERQSQDLELAKTQSRIWLLVAIAAVLGLVTVFALSRYINDRRRNKMLQEKQELTAKALAEKEVLLGEINHRVKNNLQVIYNMLDMQSRSLGDVQAKSILADSMNRVSSMALIHQELYRDGNVEGVAMQDYLTRLVEHVQDSFGGDGESVAIKMDVEKMLLDLESTIPMGMLINELVTNSFKHAFPEGRKGEIRLGLEEKEGELLLEVADNGVGSLSAESEKGGFGKRLVRSLARQLRAEIVERSSPGMTTLLKIKKYKRLDHAED